MFLICGEALFDFFADRTQANADTPHVHFEAVAGGSPYNVAVGLARLEQHSALFTGLSTDFLGERLFNVMRREGVDTRHLVRLEDATTLAMVSVSDRGCPEYAFYHECSADRALELKHLPTLAEDCKAIHVGSYSLVVCPTSDTLLALVKRESQHRLITLDPNVRLNIEPNLQLWQERVEAFAQYADVIKISDEDTHMLYDDLDGEALAHRWLMGKTNLVLLTRGSRGLTVFTRDGRFDVPTKPVKVVDAVGAGDTFQAAILCWLSENDAVSSEVVASLSREQITNMVRFAHQAAGITCTRRGPDLPRRHEVPEVAALEETPV